VVTCQPVQRVPTRATIQEESSAARIKVLPLLASYLLFDCSYPLVLFIILIDFDSGTGCCVLAARYWHATRCWQRAISEVVDKECSLILDLWKSFLSVTRVQKKGSFFMNS
jgi:hypothetical protein